MDEKYIKIYYHISFVGRKYIAYHIANCWGSNWPDKVYIWLAENKPYELESCKPSEESIYTAMKTLDLLDK